MDSVGAIISDFGGVLTSPLAGSFDAFREATGITLEQLGMAMAAIGARRGGNPLFDLETGRLGEPEFLALLGEQLSTALEREVALDGFGESYFANLEPNARMIDYMRSLRGRGYRMAICTNNVREWAPLWRAMLPVQEIFDVVVDSAFVGSRKPEPRIYELTLAELKVGAEEAVFVDDIEINCDAARALGMQAVWFQDSEQAIAEIDGLLGAPA